MNNYSTSTLYSHSASFYDSQYSQASHDGKTIAPKFRDIYKSRSLNNISDLDWILSPHHGFPFWQEKPSSD